MVVGAQVASETGLVLGDEVISSHGLTAETASEQHESQPFRVVGVLQPTGSIIDRLLLTAVETVWLVHEPHEEEGRITTWRAMPMRIARAMFSVCRWTVRPMPSAKLRVC